MELAEAGLQGRGLASMEDDEIEELEFLVLVGVFFYC
jgi:hypothetical protein